jgi:hypothetical protein
VFDLAGVGDSATAAKTAIAPPSEGTVGND